MGPLFTFEGVGVAFGGNRVLTDVELDLPEGGCTVLVGPSGSGKSTLLRLCNRLEVPAAGVVRFRGEDVAHLDVLRHRRRVGMVFQRPVAFGGSVLDNLRVARPGLDGGAAAEALERVGLSALFLEREQATLSGGEAQRACLARTLLTEPEVVLLDEPTSSVDSRTELVILDALDRLMVGRTTFIIAHRLSTVRRADQILVLDDGRIVERGTHEQLLANDGLYAEFYAIQSAGLRRGQEEEYEAVSEVS